MKIICSKDPLVAAVASVSRAVSSKSPSPALEGILIKAENDSVILTGYDLEMGIITTLPVTVGEPGEIVIPARILLDMVRRIPSDTVTITIGDKNLCTIEGGATEYTLLGLPASEYPELPPVGGENTLSMPQPVLKSMIDQTLFAIATTDSKPVHTGTLFDIKNGELLLVSVDGYRMALRREPLIGEEMQFIVPGKTLGEISKLLGEDHEKVVSFTLSRKHIAFSINDYQVISRLLEGEFLDYNAAIPAAHNTTVRVSTRTFLDSIERTSLIISDRLRSPLKVDFEKDKICVTCTTALGKAYDEIPCSTQGDTLEMGFNNKYLQDAFKAVTTDEVLLQMSGPLSPVKVVPPEGNHFLFLVLPVRLKG